MKFFATILSGLFFFFPAFLFAYYLAYTYGITEVFDRSPTELGVNYSEFVFLGFMEFTPDFLHKLTILLRWTVYIVIYCFALFSAIALGIHASARKKFWNKVDFTYYQAHKFFNKNKAGWMKSVNSIPAAIYFLYFFFMVSTIPILAKYKQGETEGKAVLEQVQYNPVCLQNEGYMLINDEMYRLKKVLCGNSKCLVLDLSQSVSRIITPEQYISPIITKLREDSKNIEQ